MPGWLFYEDRNYAVRFTFKDNYTLSKVRTMPLMDGLNDLATYGTALRGSVSQN